MTYLDKDQNWQDETTIYWFDINDEIYGVSDCNGVETIVNCDGYPVNINDRKYVHLLNNLIITDGMRRE